MHGACDIAIFTDPMAMHMGRCKSSSGHMHAYMASLAPELAVSFTVTSTTRQERD